MKVTVKGQVTIPLALRERFNLRPGTEVELVAGKDALQIRPRATHDSPHKAFDLWLSKAAGSARGDLSTDELMAITRGED